MFLTLMYHLVDATISSPMSVSEESFTTQMQLLKELGVTFLHLQDVKQILAGVYCPEKPVLITFDDGYKNTTEIALPILQHFNIPATVSLCSSYLRQETCPAETVHVSRDFARISDIQKWINSGRDIAGHTCSHPKLTKISTAEAEYEIREDKHLLESFFQCQVDAFFYPFGSVNDEVQTLVRKYYQIAFAVDKGGWPSTVNQLTIRRLEIRPQWSLEDFKVEIEQQLASATGSGRMEKVG